MTSKQNVQQKVNLRDFKDLVDTIAKVEYQKFSTSHLIELPELINIEIIHYTFCLKIIRPNISTIHIFQPQLNGQ